MLLWQNEFLEGARKQGADMVLKEKKDSALMRVLGKLLFFVRNFDRFATTIGKTVYVPSIDSTRLETLAHEMQHVLDHQRFGLFYVFAYTWPQNFALFSLFSFWSLWWLLCLLFLIPLPSPGRMIFERRGYLMSLLVMRWRRGDSLDKDTLMKWRTERKELLWATSQFVGSSYYFMWPFQSRVERWFEEKAARGMEPADCWEAWVREFAEKYRSA